MGKLTPLIVLGVIGITAAVVLQSYKKSSSDPDLTLPLPLPLQLRLQELPGLLHFLEIMLTL
jgi:hypothetical protein